MSDPQDYTVGWICALGMEHDAAVAVLEEINSLPIRAPRDNSLYTLGKIRTHNVVIATASVDERGAVPVAKVRRDMLLSFPNLRVALILSIAPDQSHDARPGDVLVGNLPNSHDDFPSHEMALREWPSVETESLGQSFASLRTAVCELRNKHELNGNRLERSIQQTLQNWPQMQKGYSRPTVESDAPAFSNFDHSHSDSEGNRLRTDDPSRLVSRHKRDYSAIHYRFSAHANIHPNGKAAAKSADSCVEMEASKLTDSLPCLLVRGICDFADSNKNEAWHGFAAMAAAAYAKDLICQIPCGTRETMPHVDSQRIGVSGVDLKCDLSEPRSIPCESLAGHQRSVKPAADETPESHREANKSSGTYESDPTLASRTKRRPGDNDRCRDEAGQVARLDTVPIAARPVAHCQQSHMEGTATLNGKSHEADAMVSPVSPATYSTSRLKRKRQRDAYINAIHKDDVFKLASSYNHDRDCIEFRKPENGSFHVCFFVEFPCDGQKWVVRFPICPVLHEPWQKLRSEIATMEYIQLNTTIPIPRVYGHGPGGDLDLNNATGLPYVILEYIVGQPFDPKRLLKEPYDNVQKFYTQLGDALSQLRAQEFEYAGSVTKDGKGFVIASPRSVDLNSIQLHGRRTSVARQATAIDFAMCHYDILAQRLSLPTEEMGEDDAQHEIFALEDFKMRLFQLMDPDLNFEPFVLSHGDLRPSNIIVSEDFTIKGIIDWEWSTTVPRQFFMPPLWFSGYEVSSPGDSSYHFQYAIFYQALLRAGATSGACQKLALEWGPDLGSSCRLFLPEALLHHHAFMEIYYRAVFPKFFKGVKRQHRLEEFYKSSRIFREAVRVKVDESKKYRERLIADGLLDPEIRRIQELEFDALCLKAAQLLKGGTASQIAV